MSSRESKRKAPLPQKSKAKAGLQAAVAAAAAGAATKTAAARAGVAASRLPRGSDSAVAPNLAGFRNGMAAAFVGHGSSSPPTPNPSAVGSSHGRCGSISPSSPFGHQSSWDPAWDNSTHPPGGFMDLFNNQPHLSQNSHFVGAPSHYAPFKAPRPIDVGISFASMDAPQLNNHGSSSQGVEVLSDEEAIEVDSDIENVRTEKRIMWTPDEDEKLMSAWLKNSTDSSIGADRNNEHYWGDVVKSYNMTIPSQRKRNAKQAKDRWHKINRWTDLYECAYLKARRVFTSGYSDQMWIDAADKFYLEDNKKAKLGPFVLKTITAPQTQEDKLYASMQEGARKDVECAFGVLQSRFDIVNRPSRLWKREDVINIMQACVILHNMIVEDEKELVRVSLDLNENASTTIVLPPEVHTSDTPNPCFADVLRRNSAIQARPTHRQLRDDLVEHIWLRYGNKEN